MCKHKLEQTPFCICQNLNPNTLSSSKLLPSKQRSTKFIFLGLWLCNASLNKFPFARAKTQSKHTFIFTAATHKQRCSIAAFAPYVGKNCGSEAVCLAWCTNVECASAPPEAKRSVHCTLCSARPHRTLHNTWCFAVHVKVFTQKKNRKTIVFFCSHQFLAKNAGIYSVLWPCTDGVHCTCTVRALYVHCKTRR